MTRAAITAIAYHLPEAVVTNQELSEQFPEWSIERIQEKTGIAQRHISAETECASDLAVAAANKLFAQGACKPEDVQYVLLCTQSPDYFLPTTACLLQHRLGIPTTAGALDFNLGCSGYVYGLGLARGLIETDQADSVLLLTAETYSKFIHPQDKSVRTIFGDAAAATLVRRVASRGDDAIIGPYAWGTDGSGGPNLIVPSGGMRQPLAKAATTSDGFGNTRTDSNLFMNGPEIFNFTLKVVPKLIEQLLAKAGKQMSDVDFFVFHQANQYMLEYLRKKVGIPEKKFAIALANCGNTVSSTIPIALKDAASERTLKPGDLVMVVGFGVGYSWGAALLRWSDAFVV